MFGGRTVLVRPVPQLSSTGLWRSRNGSREARYCTSRGPYLFQPDPPESVRPERVRDYSERTTAPPPASLQAPGQTGVGQRRYRRTLNGPGRRAKGSLVVTEHRHVFVGGLHRSGTTPFAAVLADHRNVSGLRDTGVIENEGIYLQDVYPQLRRQGGMGRFAFRAGSHLTEHSTLAGPDSAQRLFDSWSPYWDLSRPVLVEKSPNNMVMGGFLQACFPGSQMVVVVRHPVVVALAMAKWDPLVVTRKGRRRVGIEGYVRHWVRAHQILRADAARLGGITVVRYEDLVAGPDRELERVREFLGLEGAIPSDGIRGGRSDRYARQWAAMASGGWLQRRRRRRVEQQFADVIREFGYDPETLEVTGPWPDAPAGPTSTTDAKVRL